MSTPPQASKDAVASLVELEAEMALIADLRDTAPDGDEFARFDAVWRSLDADHHRLLAALPRDAVRRLKKARAEKGLVGRA